jgi:DNA-binding NarL/FixJ family response regulator
VAAIGTPAEGKMVIQGTTLTELLEELRERAAPTVGGPAAQEPRAPGQAQLTAREREVLALMGEGLGPRAIAGRLTASACRNKCSQAHFLTSGAHTGANS